MAEVEFKENNWKIMIGFKEKRKFICLNKRKKYSKIRLRLTLGFLSITILMTIL